METIQMPLTAKEIKELEINRAYWQNRAERYYEVVIKLAGIELPVTAMIDELVEHACYVLDRSPRTWLGGKWKGNGHATDSQGRED
jgi:hypothetical protein